MAKDPAFLFYSQDFLVGTIAMSHEDRGKYIILLCLMHQMGHMTREEIVTSIGEIPDSVAAKLQTDKDGKFYNKRLEEEALKRSSYCESRSTNRLKSKTKPQKHMSKTCKTYVRHMENENEDVNKDVIEVVKALNDATKSSYRAKASGTAKPIIARLNEGHTVEELCTVVKAQAAKWLNTDMAQYLRPATLFSSSKFEGYLSDAQRNGAKSAKPDRVAELCKEHDALQTHVVLALRKVGHWPPDNDGQILSAIQSLTEEQSA